MRWNVKHFLVLICLFLSTAVQAATETYQLDPHHTYAEWHVDHFGFSHISGKWMAQGKIILDSTKPQDSKVNVVIPIAGLTTGIKELDEHLMGPLFFDAKKYPLATFVSDKVQLTGKKSAKVTGMLTVHGVSKSVTLNTKLNKMGINPITNKQSIGFSGETTLKRSDFGITTLLPGVGDDITMTIEAEGSLA